MNYPPTKRLRGPNQNITTAMEFEDPFGDDEDFTQDDLEELDIITSQAITSAAASGIGSKPVTGPTEVPGNRQHQLGLDREDSHRLLEAQHAELKRKLMEVEEGIVLKSGEIRILRDSLKGAQQEKEAQRQRQILLETQRQKEQSEREKELNKKVQALQSELQFKEAEINEMKTKLVCSDKNKMASPLPRNSPKVLNGLNPLHDGSGCSSSSSPTGSGFITKETFGAHVPSRATPTKTRRDGRDRGSSSSRSSDRQEVSRPDPFLSVKPTHLQYRGGVLLGLLLQQPLSPSSLGLSHLLSMSLTDISLTTSGVSAGFRLHSDAAAGAGESGAPRAALSPVQSLAVTGINMLSQYRPEPAASSRNSRLCPGAVLLLPLLDLHLSRLCQALDSLRSTSGSNSTRSLPAGHAALGAALGRLEEAGLTGFSKEDIGLAALRLLYLLVTHSDEVVEAVVTKESLSGVTDQKTDHFATGVGLCSQNALLQSVLRLVDAGLGSSSSQREKLVLSTMKTLCVLIERTPHTHSDRLQCVLPVLCVCFSADSTLCTVSECASVLTSMCDHQALAQQLCCHHDPCVFLKLFQFIRIRADSQATHADWVQLDLQVVRLLSRLLTQRAEMWTTSQNSTCPCHTELVQTVVIVFHRQWLELRGSQELTDPSGLATPPHQNSTPLLPWWQSPAASLLRECLMLLHWLLLHHGSFSDSLRPLLHMYDQVIPAVRDTLRSIPELSESEELALEEICRSEGEDTDDMEVDAVS